MPTPALSDATSQPERRARRRREAGRRARDALARLELELAALELKKKVASLGIGIGLGSSARRSSALFVLGFLFATIAAALATFLADLARAADRDARPRASSPGVLGAARRSARLKKGTPPVPEQAIHEAKLTTEALKS